MSSADGVPQVPACPAATPPVIEFDGLPHRLAYGLETDFTTRSDDSAGTSVGAISLTVRNRNGTVVDQVDDGAELDDWTLSVPPGTAFRDGTPRSPPARPQRV
ncbi:MAG: hypothetical protein REI11_20090 [Patulibacter sp.]|nr:hypothetical protein [Patulibacter sp.]